MRRLLTGPATTVPDTVPDTVPVARATFELDHPWAVHPQVSIRPERFGALLYHFGTRRLSFLKDPRLLTVLENLTDAPSARDACVRAGVTAAELPSYRAALGTLAGSSMIQSRSRGERPGG